MKRIVAAALIAAAPTLTLAQTETVTQLAVEYVPPVKFLAFAERYAGQRVKTACSMLTANSSRGETMCLLFNHQNDRIGRVYIDLSGIAPEIRNRVLRECAKTYVRPACDITVTGDVVRRGADLYFTNATLEWWDDLEKKVKIRR